MDIHILVTYLSMSETYALRERGGGGGRERGGENSNSNFFILHGL